MDFVNNPDLAGNFIYAVPIMVWGMEEGIFTGLKISSYIIEAILIMRKLERLLTEVIR